MEEDPPIVRLTNMLLLDAIKRGASHVRVREGVSGGVDERDGRAWRDLGLATHEKLWRGVIARLKLMADIEPHTVTLCGSRIRLVTGPEQQHDFDVTLARAPAGAVIVLGLVPPAEQHDQSQDDDVRATRAAAEEHVATAVASAERGDHDGVRRAIRKSVELASSLGETFDAATAIRRAASLAHWVGLEDVAIELLDRVLQIRAVIGLVQPAEVVDVELALGDAYEALDRFTLAQPHFERAVEAAEQLGPESGLLVISLACAGRGRARLDDVTRAMSLLERADALATILTGHDSSLLMPRLELARVLRASDANAAARALERVLELADSFDDAEMIQRALGELAETELARGEVTAASDYAQRALAIIGAHPSALSIYEVRARALLLQDRRSEALTVLRAAADIARMFRPPTHPDRIAIENELAQTEQSSPYR